MTVDLLLFVGLPESFSIILGLTTYCLSLVLDYNYHDPQPARSMELVGNYSPTHLEGT